MEPTPHLTDQEWLDTLEVSGQATTIYPSSWTEAEKAAADPYYRPEPAKAAEPVASDVPGTIKYIYRENGQITSIVEGPALIRYVKS